MVQVSPFWSHISLTVEQAQEGQATAQIAVRDVLLNRVGTVQGGVLATLIDVATGAAVSTMLPPEKTIVTTDLHVQYVLPAEGDVLYAHGVSKHIGRSLAVATAEIYDAKQQLVALGHASFRIR